MYYLPIILLVSSISPALVITSVVADDDSVEEQGLYSKSDYVTILTKNNFDKHVYDQKYALVIQFYNSYCGHCRAFAPVFKALAADIASWQKIVRLGVLDCSVEENNEACRDFDIFSYPSIRYLHDHYVKGNGNVGESLKSTDTMEKLKIQILNKMQFDQSMNLLNVAPSLQITLPSSYKTALTGNSPDVLYTFLIFENDTSIIGSEIILDMNNYKQVRVKRVSDTSQLANEANLNNFPRVVVVLPSLQTTDITPYKPTKKGFLKAINTFLKNHNYEFPTLDVILDKPDKEESDITSAGTGDIIYYNDLEKTIKTSLHTEITRHKILSGEPLEALLKFLDVLKSCFPFRGNLKAYITDLDKSLKEKSEWGGSEIYNVVKNLETLHAPVYSTELDYIGCKGSQVKYRGYTCGLWTLFHTLTVNAAQKPGTLGPEVLKAMHGYIKHFFGCSECQKHFAAMAARNRIFDVHDNDKAILWLWISHNEVNLRLAGDITEDPKHPKVQFPSVTNCEECRLSRGAWNLPAVHEYLRHIYSAENIQGSMMVRPAGLAQSPFSNLDLGLLSLLYILTFIIIILLIKFFLSKRFYRKRIYKHGWGKV